jgi:hypothetical protein
VAEKLFPESHRRSSGDRPEDSPTHELTVIRCPGGRDLTPEGEAPFHQRLLLLDITPLIVHQDLTRGAPACFGSFNRRENVQGAPIEGD